MRGLAACGLENFKTNGFPDELIAFQAIINYRGMCAAPCEGVRACGFMHGRKNLFFK